MAVKWTLGGPNAPHIKTLTLGKNIVIIQRATGNGPPDTKVVDVDLHGRSHNSLVISIRSRGRHPLTRLDKRPLKPLSLTVCRVQPGFLKIKSNTATTKINWSHKLTVSELVVRIQTDHVKKRIKGNYFRRRSLKC